MLARCGPLWPLVWRFGWNVHSSNDCFVRTPPPRHVKQPITWVHHPRSLYLCLFLFLAASSFTTLLGELGLVQPIQTLCSGHVGCNTSVLLDLWTQHARTHHGQHDMDNPASPCVSVYVCV